MVQNDIAVFSSFSHINQAFLKLYHSRHIFHQTWMCLWFPARCHTQTNWGTKIPRKSCWCFFFLKPLGWICNEGKTIKM